VEVRHLYGRLRATLSLATPQSTMHQLWNRVNETRVSQHASNALSASAEVGWIVSRAS